MGTSFGSGSSMLEKNHNRREEILLSNIASEYDNKHISEYIIFAANEKYKSVHIHLSSYEHCKLPLKIPRFPIPFIPVYMSRFQVPQKQAQNTALDVYKEHETFAKYFRSERRKLVKTHQNCQTRLH